MPKTRMAGVYRVRASERQYASRFSRLPVQQKLDLVPSIGNIRERRTTDLDHLLRHPLAAKAFVEGTPRILFERPHHRTPQPVFYETCCQRTHQFPAGTASLRRGKHVKGVDLRVIVLRGDIDAVAQSATTDKSADAVRILRDENV